MILNLAIDHRAKTLVTLFFLVSTLTLPRSAQSQDTSPDISGFWVEAEAGAVWQTKNDVQIPADTGSRFSLASIDKSPGFSGRIYLGYRLSARHEVRALYAPLTLNLKGTLTNTVRFQNEVFVPNVDTEAKYTFNSYRLTYRYVFRDDDVWTLRAGFTGKVRDAEIELAQGSRQASRSNTGFVPLLHFSATYRLNPEFRIHLDADALAAPQGRAEDVALLAGYRPYDRTEFRIGYRTVEGGTDGSGGVYNFAWLHYAVAGVHHEF